MSGLQVRLIRERRDYYWNWSEDEGWQSQFDQKDLIENEQTLDLQADETGKVSFPVSGALIVWKSKRRMKRSVVCVSGLAIAGRTTATGAVPCDPTVSR